MAASAAGQSRSPVMTRAISAMVKAQDSAEHRVGDVWSSVLSLLGGRREV